MVLSEVNFNVGGGTIILVSQKINPSMGKLRRGVSHRYWIKQTNLGINDHLTPKIVAFSDKTLKNV